MNQAIGTDIKEKGWCQGSILQDGALLEQDNPKREAFGVVISQSCDIVNNNLETEPYVEVLIATITTDVVASLMYGKNPRVLHVYLQKLSGDPIVLELKPWKKVLISREEFINRKPADDCFLNKSDVIVVKTWMANRYIRGALPDDFNNMISEKSFRRKWEKSHKKMNPYISELLVKLYPEGDLKGEDKYSVNLLALVPVIHEERLMEARQEVKRIGELLKSIGMDVKAEASLEDKIPYSVVREMTRFPLEHLSFKGDNFLPLPSDFGKEPVLPAS
ncbi:hypothetical protein [Cobetia crustatorum]|uniref:Uncharacterized protein n=1 Tax=Cobetia crustatorum TaxID=553385 RepID=A0A558HHU9_9GAMM|nr:hypothetical protein [Cobetia crustatorum]TVU68693.1 hypothetical protein FQP86_12920 [Cobetia crustatorum]